MKIAVRLMFFFLCINQGYSFQENALHRNNPDLALIKWIKNSKSTDSIRDFIYETMAEDVLLAIDYAKIFLHKAKRKDSSMQYLAYYDLAYTLYQNSEYLKATNYTDSSLLVIPKGDSKKSRTLSSYLLKGSAYNDNRQYKKALEAFLTGEKIIGKDQNLIQYRLGILNNIGVIRIEIEEYEDALITFKEVFKLMGNLKDSENFVIADYSSAILHLALSYYETGDIKNATKYNEIGLQLSIDHDINENEGLFLMNMAEILIEKGSPDLALEKLYKAKKKLNNGDSNVNFLLANYYIAKAFYIKNEYKKSHATLSENFKLIKDKKKSEIKNILEMYDLAYLCAEKLGNPTKQLEYSNAYREVQKVLYKNDTDTRRIIYKENVEELRNKNQVLFSKNSMNKKNVVILILLISVLIIFIIYILLAYKRKLKKSKVLFEQLQEKVNQKIFETKLVKDFPKNNQALTDEKAKSLLKNLSELEKERFYIKIDCNLYTTAKLLNTNTVYLSKVINQQKEKSFIEYLNELRIDYLLEVLKTDSKFKSYTIKGIGEELGYKSINTFVKAFKTHTGLTPSYYLKQIKKNASITETAE